VTLSLLFGVHAHQPAGNFPEVFESAHARCYKPFLEILHKYPDFRFAVHFSGPLLDYLFDHHPRDMELLVEMVERGQVEMFGAGDTEPVLASIPERDRVGQLERLSRKLEWRFGKRPTGAWLTERVWEATVVPALAKTGIEYVTVDDYHFLCTGKQANELDGYFTTEEGDHRLDLFPISEQLRYRFPFSPAVEAVAYLQQLADEGGTAAIYFDDIEKFGIWPETYAWVYERGWLREFIERVLASQAVKTQTFAEYHAAHRTRGIVYLPTTSYIEMNEWTLPAGPAHEFASLVEREKKANTYEAHKPFVRGGIWKNFMSRYPEANWMHKRMTSLSRRLDEIRPQLDEGQRNDLDTQLYLAQANDAYWHGLFGGVYMPHLRRGIYKSLVNLESGLDRHSPRPAAQVMDVDLDGKDELLLHSERLQAIVKLDGRAAVCELDAYELGQNFGDTLRRTTEHYHRKALEAPPAEAKAGGGIASAHDRFNVKHDIKPADMAPDSRGRGLFNDSWNGAQLVEYEMSNMGPGHLFVVRRDGLAVDKAISVRDNKLIVDYRLDAAAAGAFQVEIDVAMPCCDGYAGRYIRYGQILGGFGQPLSFDGGTEITLDDRYMNGSVTLASSRELALKAAPYYTVSQSEDGLEKVMQSVTLTLAWAVPAGSQETSLVLEARGGFDESWLSAATQAAGAKAG
jgi:4-alpha-glucanotransferase